MYIDVLSLSKQEKWRYFSYTLTKSLLQAIREYTVLKDGDRKKVPAPHRHSNRHGNDNKIQQNHNFNCKIKSATTRSFFMFTCVSGSCQIQYCNKCKYLTTPWCVILRTIFLLCFQLQIAVFFIAKHSWIVVFVVQAKVRWEFCVAHEDHTQAVTLRGFENARRWVEFVLFQIIVCDHSTTSSRTESYPQAYRRSGYQHDWTNDPCKHHTADVRGHVHCRDVHLQKEFHLRLNATLHCDYNCRLVVESYSQYRARLA